MGERPVIIWGAGRIGRGFNAEVFHQSGYRVVFVDMVKPLIDQLRKNGAYTIYKAKSEGVSSVRIEGYEAYHIDEQAAIMRPMLEKGLIVSAAVQASMLDSLAGMLKPYIRERARQMPEEPMDILLNVNMMMPDHAFRAALSRQLADDPAALRYAQEKIGLSVTVVMRIVPMTPEKYLREDPLALYTNGFPELVADRLGFKGQAPNLPMLRLTDDILAEESRKIYTLNLSHAAASYLSYQSGLTYMAEAVGDPRLRPLIQQALAEAAVGLCGEYRFTPEEMARWNETVIMPLIENPHIGDDLRRLGADSRRKLGGDDRLVGAARLCLKHGGKPQVLALAIKKGYSFENDDEGTRYVRKCVQENGLAAALRIVSGLEMDEPLYRMILEL